MSYKHSGIVLAMYVCVCHKVTDKQIQRAVRDGAEDLCDVMEQLMVATNCGSCAEHAMQIIQATLAEGENLNFDLAYQVA